MPMLGKSIVILSLSPIADDPRVRRQGEAFHAAGWKVTAVGVGTARSPAPVWPIIQADAPVSVPSDDGSIASAAGSLPSEGLRTKAVRIGRAVIPPRWRFLIRVPVRAAFKTLSIAKRILDVAHNVKWLLSLGRAPTADVKTGTPSIVLHDLPPAMDEDTAEREYLSVYSIRRMYEAARHLKADFYLANDWHMLPVARRLAKEHGGRFGYDTHEYAVEEYRYKPDFLTTKVPMVRAIEARGLREAAVTTAVSAGIAKDMAALHGAPSVPVEIRNVPNRVADLPPPQPTRPRMRVYFHGIITFDRGLEECIRSVPLWRPEFVFQMRGPIREEYMATLKGAIIEAGVWDRVELLPEVAMVDLVRAAADADIGISTPPSTSKHNIYALPNKFFEYIQAGLAMCVADLPDMRRIMDHYDLGRSISAVTPEAIAEAVNGFTPELVDRYKANARKAAAELNWESEQRRLVDLYENALAKA